MSHTRSHTSNALIASGLLIHRKVKGRLTWFRVVSCIRCGQETEYPMRSGKYPKYCRIECESLDRREGRTRRWLP